MKYRKPTYTLVMNFYVVLRIILSVFLLYIMYTKISFDWKTFGHFTRDRKRIPSIGRVSSSVFSFMISSLNTFLTFKFYLLEQQCINLSLMQSYYCLFTKMLHNKKNSRKSKLKQIITWTEKGIIRARRLHSKVTPVLDSSKD